MTRSSPPASNETMPVLDLRRFEADRADFLGELREAVRRYGFFLLRGLSVDPWLIERVLSLARQVFALPPSEKLAVEVVNLPHFRGSNRAEFKHTRGRPA